MEGKISEEIFTTIQKRFYRYHKLRKTFFFYFNADTMNWRRNIMLNWRNVCNKVYRNQNSEKLPYWEILFFRNDLESSRLGYNLDVMRQTECLLVILILVDKYALHFNWTAVVRVSDSIASSI